MRSSRWSPTSQTRKIPAAEMASAYHERWEAELVFDEIKTHQRGAGGIIRSRYGTVEQEIWGLLLTHYGIPHLMREAADQAELDPDRMSFIRALRVVRRQVSGQAAFSPRRLAAATREAIEEILERPNPARRERTCPRAVKRPQHTAFLMKRRDQKNIQHDYPPTIRLFHPAA